jgi:hypothetical protein
MKPGIQGRAGRNNIMIIQNLETYRRNRNTRGGLQGKFQEKPELCTGNVRWRFSVW